MSNYTYKLSALFDAATIAGIDVTSVSINPIIPLTTPPNMVSVPIAGRYVTSPASPSTGHFRFVEAVTDVTGGKGFVLAQMFVSLTVPSTRRVYNASLTSEIVLSDAANALSVEAVLPIVNNVSQGEETFNGFATMLPVNGGLSYIVNIYLTPN